MMLDLTTNTIQLWCALPDQIQDKPLLKEYYLMLSETEKSQMQRLIYRKDQHRFLIRHALVRTTLSRYAKVLPKDWIFEKNIYGKPYIANDIILSTISINVSYSENIILLGITRNHSLGVDVENVTSRAAPINIAKEFYCESETAALRTLSSNEQSLLFYKYWTLKESYLKAVGIGLSAPLNSISFGFAGNSEITVCMDPFFNDLPSRWQFWQFQPFPEHVAAVCVARNFSKSQTISLNQVIPLKNEKKMDATNLTTSKCKI
jgi:4'-phosphopantetheinyl transferase